MGLCANWEEDCIDPADWDKLYDKMPKECQAFVRQMRKQPDCMGLGRNKKFGWFIHGSGQGPSIYWAENRDEWLRYEHGRKSI